ncbi:CBS domain-containing protein [Terrilactibacillus sp. BCM23-1]|uniref:CBS domain-containing protein n=1 Tax=Terrilactibacillus tamarindi TaxID=2599694 RepID=A0A6N8CT17_9BACI|nr:CBS domain-containing protein [Terrilactibacillus tamarindi]MTT33201.1 CBS domain-containing protein [Terrilactibacillus tamarindi]
MNIAFFITPKSEVKYVCEDWTMRQAMEKMEYNRYTAVPILNQEGKYVGTLTEGDLLWKLKNMKQLDFNQTNNIMLQDVPLHTRSQAVSINDDMENIINNSLTQNFVPVMDDLGIFIGIIRRREIIEYLMEKVQNNKNEKMRVGD